MTNEQYMKMVKMLIAATVSEKIKWIEQNGDFLVSINKCQISLSSSYDISIDSSTYSLSLMNTDGIMFETYTFDENSDKEKFDKLNILYGIIKDKTYKISESENLIINGLEELLKN